MKSIYILLTKSDTVVSKAIHLVAADQYSHVSISFDKTLQPLYSFSRKYIYLPLPAGICHEPLSEGFYKKYHYIPCALYELKVEDEIYNTAKQIAENMLKESQAYKFNVLGLILCKFNIPYDRKNYYFCSEFVSEVLLKSQALYLPKLPCLMRPADYANIAILECVFKGRLEQLINQLKFNYSFLEVS